MFNFSEQKVQVSLVGNIWQSECIESWRNNLCTIRIYSLEMGRCSSSKLTTQWTLKWDIWQMWQQGNASNNIVKTDIKMKCYFRFILITHNSDYPVPRQRADRRLLKHPLLIRWFAQNIAHEYRDHKKMEAIPLGLPNRCIGYQLSDIEPYLEWVIYKSCH